MIPKIINDFNLILNENDYRDFINATEYRLENAMSNDSTFYLNFTSTSGKGKIRHPKKYAN